MQKYMWIVLIIALLALALALLSLYQTMRFTKSTLHTLDFFTSERGTQVTTMAQKLDAKQFSIWPDKRTPTKELNIQILNGLDTETLEELDGKSVIYVGMYANNSGVGLLDEKIAVHLDKNMDTTLLKELSRGNTLVRVWGVFHLQKNLHDERYMLDAGRIELVTDETPVSQIAENSYMIVTSQELWDRRGELSGKKISLTTELDTDTMILQPPPFTGPIELTRNTDIEDLWLRNMGKQTVTIQGTFFHNLSIEETGKTHEVYKIVVDSMPIFDGITRSQALQIAQDEAKKEVNGSELLKLETEITGSEGTWHVSFLYAEGKGATVGGGLPEYVIDAKTGEVLSRLLQR